MIPDTQVKYLRTLVCRKTMTIKAAAAKAAICEASAHKYLRTEKLPSELKTPPKPSGRSDAFVGVWSECVPFLEVDPKLAANALFDYMVDKYPDQFKPSQLRTFQHRVKAWKAQQPKEVFFAQLYQPGDRAQSDFTCMNRLGITIQGVPWYSMVGGFRMVHQRTKQQGRAYRHEAGELLSSRTGSPDDEPLDRAGQSTCQGTAGQDQSQQGAGVAQSDYSSLPRFRQPTTQNIRESPEPIFRMGTYLVMNNDRAMHDTLQEFADQFKNYEEGRRKAPSREMMPKDEQEVRGSVFRASHAEAALLKMLETEAQPTGMTIATKRTDRKLDRELIKIFAEAVSLTPYATKQSGIQQRVMSRYRPGY